MLDHRPVLPRWIVRMTSSNHSATVRFERKEYRATPALDQSDAQAGFVGNRKIDMMQTERQVSHYSLHETGGFSDFIEAHGDPRCDITLGANGLFGCQVAVRITRQV